MSNQDIANGVGPSSPNPQTLIEQKTGIYHDETATMPQESKLPTSAMPKGPDPNPFSITGKPSGGR